ncbi:MAG TPA: PEP-utilizing enzyme [Solirubrobacterales bacterium]|nr:PEP-utilizing enzyme [Solirubrobacterales bacterium]
MSRLDVDTSRLSKQETEGLAQRSGEFVLASTNVDEDVHFSNLYLESTLAPPDPRWGIDQWYTELVALNRQAIENYYLLKSECASISTRLSDVVMNNPRVLTTLLHEVERRSGLLDSAFPFGWLESSDSGYDLSELTDIYMRHLALHRYLYEVARLPEALDRGTGAFTTRLREIVEDRSRDLPVETAFLALSAVGKPSMFRAEQLEFVQISESLSSQECRAVKRSRTGALALMALCPDSRANLIAHRRRWAPLFYHGYGSRDPVALSELAARLRQILRRGTAEILPRLPDTEEREEVVRSLRLEPKEASCFYGYGLLGWTKARRRWFQLRNFQRLDLLIERLSQHLDCPEWDLRILLPDELIRWIEGGQRPADAIEARYDSTVMWFKGDTLRVTQVPEAFEFKNEREASEARLFGDKIVHGVVTGRCVLGGRGGAPPPDEEHAHPMILVVSQLDSDLVWLLPFFDGLVVEERGASAHVSIISREIGIPTVAGVVGATSQLESGEMIMVNGDEGYVERGLDDE